MDLVSLLIALLVFCVAFYLGYWIISKCFPEPMRVIAMAVLGVVFLIILIGYFTGDVGSIGHIKIGHW